MTEFVYTTVGAPLVMKNGLQLLMVPLQSTFVQRHTLLRNCPPTVTRNNEKNNEREKGRRKEKSKKRKRESPKKIRSNMASSIKLCRED
jgi:hypothetical protein